MGILSVIILAALALSNLATAIPQPTPPKTITPNLTDYGFIIIPHSTGGLALSKLSKNIQKKYRKNLIDEQQSINLFNQLEYAKDPEAAIRAFTVTFIDKIDIETFEFGFLLDLIEDFPAEILSPDQTFPDFGMFKQLVQELAANVTAMNNV